MQKFVLTNFDETVNNVFHDRHDFGLWHFSTLLEERTEVALLAELCDDIAMRRLPDDFIALEDVGMFELSQSLDFAI